MKRKYPMQPVYKDESGVHRFEENPIVSHLAREVSDLNHLAAWCAQKGVAQKYQEQLAQLIGYSVSGYGTLSYVSDESYDRAAKLSDALADNHPDQPKEWRGTVCTGDAVKVTMDDPAYDNRRPIIAEIAFMDDKGVFLKSKELIGGCIGLPHKMVTLEKVGTERERWIEAAMKQCNAPYISPPELAEAIYTALQNGDLPMPEE